MMNRACVCGLAAALVLILFAAWASRDSIGAQEKATVAVQKWEYRIILPDNVEDPRANQNRFDKLGSDGWELCVMHSSTLPHYCVFKRPKR
jgi:hypothetical protein